MGSGGSRAAPSRLILCPSSERIPELVEYGRMLMSRNCGGSHTSTSTLPRRSCPPHAKLHGLAEADGAGQVETGRVDAVCPRKRVRTQKQMFRTSDGKQAH